MWLRRLWRRFTNPLPLGGQHWSLDGVGRVYVLHVHSRRLIDFFAVSRQECDRADCLCIDLGHVHYIDPDGVEHTVNTGTFIRNGVLWQPPTPLQLVHQANDERKASER
jgi:hypothetical protein